MPRLLRRGKRSRLKWLRRRRWLPGLLLNLLLLLPAGSGWRSKWRCRCCGHRRLKAALCQNVLSRKQWPEAVGQIGRWHRLRWGLLQLLRLLAICSQAKAVRPITVSN